MTNFEHFKMVRLFQCDREDFFSMVASLNSVIINFIVTYFFLLNIHFPSLKVKSLEKE